MSFEHAQMQKAVSEAFTLVPAYLGQLAPDHWYVQFKDMEADLDDDDFFPENGEFLARGETDEQWFFAWKLENGRFMVAAGHYPEFVSYHGVDLFAEVLPTGTTEQMAMEWVKTRSLPESYSESDPVDEAEEATSDFIAPQRQAPRARPQGNGRQPTFWERLSGRS